MLGKRICGGYVTGHTFSSQLGGSRVILQRGAFPLAGVYAAQQASTAIGVHVSGLFATSTTFAAAALGVKTLAWRLAGIGKHFLGGFFTKPSKMKRGLVSIDQAKSVFGRNDQHLHLYVVPCLSSMGRQHSELCNTLQSRRLANWKVAALLQTSLTLEEFGVLWHKLHVYRCSSIGYKTERMTQNVGRFLFELSAKDPYQIITCWDYAPHEVSGYEAYVLKPVLWEAIERSKLDAIYPDEIDAARNEIQYGVGCDQLLLGSWLARNHAWRLAIYPHVVAAIRDFTDGSFATLLYLEYIEELLQPIASYLDKDAIEEREALSAVILEHT